MNEPNDILYNSVEKDVCDPNMSWDDIILHIEEINGEYDNV